MSHTPLDAAALDQLFLGARTYASQRDTWLDRPVSSEQMRQIWDLARMGPTQTNTLPARVVWVASAESKARLAPLMDEGNRAKTVAAPVTAIIGMDLAFYEKLPYLYPHVDARAWFADAEAAHLEAIALRSSSLQGAYLIMAARALGLDCGPMSGFDAERVTAEFFPDSAVRANFMVNIGYGNPASLRPRNPRLSFEEACRIV
jgi:3-hydroxypropanoate dehydrogenase